MIAAWFNDRALAYDSETTAPDPLEARLVTATAVQVGPAGAERKGQWLVNPEVEIPAEAIAIHKVTNEMAREGLDLITAVPEISEVLLEGWREGLPLIAMNAAYDLTVLQQARARLGLAPLTLGPVLDPLVIDRGMVKFRSGKKARVLSALAEHYNVKLEGAHSSAGDALCAARVVWRQARVYPELARLDLEQMQEWQQKAHAEWAEGFEKYLRRTDPTASIERSWLTRSTQEAA